MTAISPRPAGGFRTATTGVAAVLASEANSAFRRIAPEVWAFVRAIDCWLSNRRTVCVKSTAGFTGLVLDHTLVECFVRLTLSDRFSSGRGTMAILQFQVEYPGSSRFLHPGVISRL